MFYIIIILLVIKRLVSNMHKKLSFHLLLKKVGWVTMLYIYKCRVKTIFSLK